MKDENEVRPEWNEISHLSQGVKTLWAQWDQLKVKDGVLYKQWRTPEDGHLIWQLVVPKCLVPEILLSLHDSPTGGHLGKKRLLASVRLRYYWIKVQDDVEKHCLQCDKCGARKVPPKQKRAPLRQYQVGAPLERMAVDILGPLPRTERSNRYILIIGDYFTK